jgi:hypothetical protein
MRQGEGILNTAESKYYSRAKKQTYILSQVGQIVHHLVSNSLNHVIDLGRSDKIILTLPTSDLRTSSRSRRGLKKGKAIRLIFVAVCCNLIVRQRPYSKQPQRELAPVVWECNAILETTFWDRGLSFLLPLISRICKAEQVNIETFVLWDAG